MTTFALALTDVLATGKRPVAARVAQHPATTGARFVRTARGLALFDERGRFVGVVPGPVGAPAFGPGGDTVLLDR